MARLTIIIYILASYLLAYVDLGIHGNMVEPIEPDFMLELQKKAQDLNTTLLKKQAQKSLGEAMNVKGSIPLCVKNRTYIKTPAYTLEENVYLPTGELLYAKGSNFNILSKLQFQSKIIVLDTNDRRQIDLAKQDSGNSILLVANGDIRMLQKETKNSSVYVLDETGRKSFDVMCLPTIFEQKNETFLVNEINLDGDK